MAAALALVAGILAGAVLPLWSALPQYKKKITDRCFHHSECYSGCCLMDLESGGAFCAPRARITMICLPQDLKEICIRNQDCQTGCCRRTPDICESHCTENGSEGSPCQTLVSSQQMPKVVQ
ncbi:PREDICTED: colipase-like protein 2 isoform X2 [Rhinopithecus bieti]|uniref:colipase-like protein 2 isoform X2 n=1 Tax=Rhinopithecus bieti TaxID=61621 RepID=UPI00083C340F|nr:PREDICTED: colipase-like protein 2 isoform X2 [Rhinopithecus bieti]